MMDYILVDGPFLAACQTLKQHCDHLPWIDRDPVFRRDSPLLTFTTTRKAFALDHALQFLTRNAILYLGCQYDLL